MANIFFTVFWLLDVLNVPFMEVFDTTVPINGLAWFIIFMIWLLT